MSAFMQCVDLLKRSAFAHLYTTNQKIACYQACDARALSNTTPTTADLPAILCRA